MNKVALLIGGNQGDRRALIRQAAEMIRQHVGSVVLASRVYESKPWGRFGEATPQNFFNQALLVETELTAHQVLEEALLIEAILGRLRPQTPGVAIHAVAELPKRVYQSRPMDIDIIFYNDEVINTPGLTVPHPCMHQRRFVLEPLAEIIPDYRHPVLQKTVKELLYEV